MDRAYNERGRAKDVMEGKMVGKRGPGRKHIGMLDDLLDIT